MQLHPQPQQVPKPARGDWDLFLLSGMLFCHFPHGPAQTMGCSLLLLCSQLHNNSKIRMKSQLNHHFMLFESSARQLLIFLSHESPLLDTWKLKRLGGKNKIKGGVRGGKLLRMGWVLFLISIIFYLFSTHSLVCCREIKKRMDWPGIDGIRGKAKPLLHFLLFIQNIPIFREQSIPVPAPEKKIWKRKLKKKSEKKKSKFGSNSSGGWNSPSLSTGGF